MNANIYAVLAAGFPEDRRSPCIEVPGGATYTWGDLDAGAARIANWLATLQLPGFARIAGYVEKSPEALMLHLATVRAGLVYVPLNSAYRENELRHLLDDAQPSVVVCARQTRESIAPLARQAGAQHIFTLDDNRTGSLLDAARTLAPTFATVHRAKDDPAAILFTSGTTGRSKGAVLSHGNLAANVLALHHHWAWRRDDVLLHILPIFHAHGLLIAAHGALFAGVRMIWMQKFDAAQALALLPRCTMMMGVPTHYVRLLAEPALGRDCCRNMRVFISGSAPLLAETFASFRDRTGHAVLERYGLSETLILTSNPCDTALHPRIAGTVGMPLAGVDVRVVDASGRCCARGKVGHIQARGPNVFSGYWRRAERTEDFTDDGWFRTGDLGRWGGEAGGAAVAEGYLSLAGRDKDLIISGGFNVYAREIEETIDRMDGVAESAVIGAPHPDFGEAVVAVVVPRAHAELDVTAMQAALKTRIANFKVPKRIHVAPALPRNAMGKVQKNLLRQTYGAPFERPAAGHPPAIKAVRG